MHGMDASAPSRLLTVNEVANLLGCGRTLVYELMGKGQLTHIKVGRLTRIPPAEVERFVQRRLDPEPVARPVRSRRGNAEPTPLLPLDG